MHSETVVADDDGSGLIRDLTAQGSGRALRTTEPLLAAGRTLAPQYRGIALARVSLPPTVGAES